MAANHPMAALARDGIPELAFSVQGASTLWPAALPTLRFAVQMEVPSGEAIRSVLLDTQIQIAARRRSYDAEDHPRLRELFGETHRWSDTLRTLPWLRTTLVVPPFTGATVVDLDIACSYDLDVAATRYFNALGDGDIPLEFLFSGSVFYAGADGRLQTARIAWDREADFRLPVSTWRETMRRHFGDTRWLTLSRPAFERLLDYRSRRSLGSWDDAVNSLIAHEPSED